MRICYNKGNNGEKDRIIAVTTKENEWFSIFKLSLLANQLVINERIIHGDVIFKTGRFLCVEALNQAITMGANNIDWAEESNIGLVKEWCRRNKLNFEKIEEELRRTIQMKVKDYE